MTNRTAPCDQAVMAEVTRHFAISCRLFRKISSSKLTFHAIIDSEGNIKENISKYMFSTVPADGLAPLNASISADIAMTKLGPRTYTLIARFMGPTWGPPGAVRTQVGPMLVPWTLLSGHISEWRSTHVHRTCYNVHTRLTRWWTAGKAGLCI